MFVLDLVTHSTTFFFLVRFNIADFRIVDIFWHMNVPTDRQTDLISEALCQSFRIMYFVNSKGWVKKRHFSQFWPDFNIYVSKNFVWVISKHKNSLNWAKSLQLRTFRCPKKVWWRSETLDSAIWCKNVWQNLDIKMNVEENVRFTIGFVIVWGFRNIYYMS